MPNKSEDPTEKKKLRIDVPRPPAKGFSYGAGTLMDQQRRKMDEVMRAKENFERKTMQIEKDKSQRTDPEYIKRYRTWFNLGKQAGIDNYALAHQVEMWMRAGRKNLVLYDIARELSTEEMPPRHEPITPYAIYEGVHDTTEPTEA